MKKILLIILLLINLLPAIALADFSASWQATSISQGWIFPSKINGVFPTIQIPNLISTSTATSTFAGNLQLTQQNAQVPNLTLGTGQNATTYGFTVAGGRAMVGYDLSLGALTVNGGNSKGFSVYVNGTNGTFLSGTQALFIQGNSAISPVGYVGIGTVSPPEILTIDNTANSNYTTTELINHGVTSLFDADSVDSFNGQTGYTYIGSKSNHGLVLGFNNQGQCGIYDDNTYDTLFDCYPPANGSEMTYTNSLPNGGTLIGGSGTTFVDHYLMDYGSQTGMQAGNIYARTTTAALFPDVLDGYWEQSAGQEAANTKFFSIVTPSGRMAYGSFSSSSPSVNAIQRTGAVVQLGASSTATTELTVYGSDTTATNNLFNVQRTGSIGIGTSTPSKILDIYGSFPLQRITNSNSAQFAGAGLVLANNVGTLGNQASTIFYSGINDASALQGYFGIDQGTTVGGAINHWLLFNYNTQTASFYTNGTEKLTVLSGGNVGVGTTTPASLLSVGNTNGINFSTATSTFSSIGGINLKSGCFAISNTCIGSGSSQWTTSGSDIYYSTGNVGLGGVTSPAFNLDVQTAIRVPTIYVSAQTASSEYIQIDGNGGFGTFTGSNLVQLWKRDGNSYFTGKLGVGTTSPIATVSIQGTGELLLIATSTGNSVAGIDSDGHPYTSGPAGAISSCGTGSGSVVGDDQQGVITTATAATACTMTFSKAWQKAPVCTVTDNSLVGFADISSVSTSAVTFGISSALTGGNLYYSCSYHR